MSQIYFIWSNTLHVSDGLSVHHQGIESHVIILFPPLKYLMIVSNIKYWHCINAMRILQSYSEGPNTVRENLATVSSSPVRNICTM